MRQAKLQQLAEQAVALDDTTEALAALLELDNRYREHPAVLGGIAQILQRIDLPARGLDYVDRALAIENTVELCTLKQELEDDHESWYRNLARLDLVQGRLKRAMHNGSIAAAVTSPSTWTIRVLVDIALEVNHLDFAREPLERASKLRPDDQKLAEQRSRLDG